MKGKQWVSILLLLVFVFSIGGDLIGLACRPLRADSGEVVGQAVVCVEAFTIGGGYIVEPMFVDLYAGEKASTVLLRVLDANSLSYEYTGSPQALFYLARIMGSKISELPTDASLVPPVLFQHIEETLSDESRQGNALGEFDYTYGSGWMYSVNNSFPEVGFSDYTLNDGDVMRVQFTLAYGMDIGGSSSMGPGMGFEDFYPVPNKDQMTVFLANEKELKGYIPEEYLAIVSRLDGEYILVPGVSGLPENNTLTLPADSGEITLWYGQIDHLDMGVHRGTNIQGPSNSPVYSIGDGVVSYVGASPKYGNVVYIDYNYLGVPMQVRYGNLAAPSDLRLNQAVSSGEVIGHMGPGGSSGKGLLEVVVCLSTDGNRCRAEAGNYIFQDPALFINLPVVSGDYLEKPMAVLFDPDGLADNGISALGADPDPLSYNELYRHNMSLLEGKTYLRKAVEVYARWLDPAISHDNLGDCLTWDSGRKIAAVSLNGKTVQYGESLGNGTLVNNRVVVDSRQLRLDLFGTETPVPAPNISEARKSEALRKAEESVSDLEEKAADFIKHFNDDRIGSVFRGLAASVMINTGDSSGYALQTMINMGGIFAGQLPSLEFYQEFLTTTEKLDQYMSSQAEYIDSYYFGKLIGDAASLVLGAGGTVQGAIKFFKGAGIAVGSAATPMGTMVGSVAVVLSAEGVQVMAVSGTVVVAAIGNIPGDYDKFHYYDGREVVITNKGNEIDVTPSKNHTTTTENPVKNQTPNSSVDILDEQGNIKTRRWFDENGNAMRDVDYTNHGNPSTHPEWPHEHTWDWSQNPPRQ